MITLHSLVISFFLSVFIIYLNTFLLFINFIHSFILIFFLLLLLFFFLITLFVSSTVALFLNLKHTKTNTHHEAKRVIYCEHISYDTSFNKKTCGHTAAYRKCSAAQYVRDDRNVSLCEDRYFRSTQSQNHLALHEEEDLFLFC